MSPRRQPKDEIPEPPYWVILVPLGAFVVMITLMSSGVLVMK
jgi:hypothetical protein